MTGLPARGAHDRCATPRIGITWAWFDPTEAKAWSGLTHNLVAAFERRGVFAGMYDATPWLPGPGARGWAERMRRFAQSDGGGPVARRLVRPWLWRSGRAAMWPLSPEMAGAAALTNGVRRLRRMPPDVDAWLALSVHPPVRGRLVTLCDMSPSQFRTVGPTGPGSYWVPGATRAQIEGHGRRLARMHRRAQVCAVASRWAGQSLVDDDGVDARRVHVVGFGHDVEMHDLPERDWSVPRFLFVGRDWVRKNGAGVVRAFAQVRQRVPSATLDVVGNHPPLDVEGVTGHGPLTRTERADREKLDRLSARSTCFVMPSVIEPFGIVYLEAAAHGIPSIATSIGGTADSVGEGGVLVDPADDEELGRAMDRMAVPTEAAALGAVAFRRAASFTWDAVADRLLLAATASSAHDPGPRASQGPLPVVDPSGAR